ncbi:MAG TPA: Uma2 family endonuclease [Thermoanaerobaculia bacterium]|nr:Uma2 family endonuclease [Thermoanaerobaculia bacterium]
MSVDSIPRLTPDEYLALERTAEIKSEFLDGQMIAMTGGSIRHGRIASNLVQAIGLQLRGRSCEVFGSDVRVLVAQTGLYTYPDVTIVCGEPTLTDEHLDTLTNPTVLIEVLSPSTAAYDRTTKFEHYRALAALREYLLVSQDQPKVEQYVRQENRKDWLFTEKRDLEGSIVLPSIECALKMAEIYARVRFDDHKDTPVPPVLAPGG